VTAPAMTAERALEVLDEAAKYVNSEAVPMREARAFFAAMVERERAQVNVLHEARRAIGDHHAPNDCYATGPLTGNAFRDLVQCPACSFIAMFDELKLPEPQP